MMMTWRRPEAMQVAREEEDIFQQKDARMTIEQEDSIVHPFIHRQFLHNRASRRIIQDWKSKMFHFGELGHLDFKEQFIETVDNAREFPFSEANVDYPGFLQAIFEAYPLRPSDAHR